MRNIVLLWSVFSSLNGWAVGSLTAPTTTSTSVTLAWDYDLASVPAPAEIRGFNLIVRLDPEPPARIFVPVSAITNGVAMLCLTNLAPEKSYAFQVDALYQTTNDPSLLGESGLSNLISYTPGRQDGEPPKLVLGEVPSLVWREVLLQGVVSDANFARLSVSGDDLEERELLVKGPEGTFSATVQLPKSGPNTIVLKAEDWLGNITTKSLALVDLADLDDDRDGLTNTQEIYVTGTDPLNPDTDGDGLNDGNEYELGYDPLKPEHLTRPSLDRITPTIRGSLVLTFRGITATGRKWYGLESSTNLVDWHLEKVTSTLNGDQGVFEVPFPANSPLIYRLEENPQFEQLK